MSGINDITILGSIISIFVVMGIALPFIQAEFYSSEYSGLLSDGVSVVNTDGGELDISDASTVSIFKIFFSVVGMFFWTFGLMPLWIDAIFLILRIIFWLTLARNIWVGGGS